VGVPTIIEGAELLWARSEGTFTPRAHNELTITSNNYTRVDVCLDLALLILNGEYRDVPLLVL
jgi:hypothetical protein